MRTGLWISLVLLALTIGCGCLEEKETRWLSQRYTSAAKEIKAMSESAQWPRARETLSAYLTSWEKTVPWLQVFINHEDIDNVTLALVRLQATLEAQEQSACLEACAELHEHAQHLYHRGAFTLGNVL